MKKIFIMLLRSTKRVPLTKEQLQEKRRRDCAAIQVVAKSQYEDKASKPNTSLNISHTEHPTYRWSFETVQKNIQSKLKRVPPPLAKLKPKKSEPILGIKRELKVA